MTDTPELLIACNSAEDVDRALGLGFAIETTRAVAAECGAPEPGDPDLADDPEAAIEAYLHAFGRDGEADSQ